MLCIFINFTENVGLGGRGHMVPTNMHNLSLQKIGGFFNLRYRKHSGNMMFFSEDIQGHGKFLDVSINISSKIVEIY